MLYEPRGIALQLSMEVLSALAGKSGWVVSSAGPSARRSTDVGFRALVSVVFLKWKTFFTGNIQEDSCDATDTFTESDVVVGSAYFILRDVRGSLGPNPQAGWNPFRRGNNFEH